jgi:hypothetical protein
MVIAVMHLTNFDNKVFMCEPPFMTILGTLYDGGVAFNAGKWPVAGSGSD